MLLIIWANDLVPEGTILIPPAWLGLFCLQIAWVHESGNALYAMLSPNHS